jgi:hypothetical protein
MVINVDALQDKLVELSQTGTEEQLSQFLIEEVAPLLDEVRELRNRVNFLEIEKTELESKLDEERGP